MTAAPMNTCAGALRPLTAALTLALASMSFVDNAAAQSAPGGFQVLELDYAPARATPGLDLRPGRYLLQLRGTGVGSFEGLLRGPRNEVVAERISFSASSGCGAGVPAAAVISTRAMPAQRGLNVLKLEIGDGTGGCTLEGLVPKLGLTSINVTGNEPDCDPPQELPEFGTVDSDPACAPPPPPPELPIAAATPELKPTLQLQLAGRSIRWSDRVVLPAAQAQAYADGRCFFSYAYAIENAGRAASAPTDSSLLLERRLDLQLDSRPLPRIDPGAASRVQGLLALPPGSWRVYVHADVSERVGEWDGQDNARSILIEVRGPCAATGTK